VLILMAIYTIIGSTALSLSSLATNIRIRRGGAYSIVAQALGLEAGGAIGLPLFIARTLSGTMYLLGFAEAVKLLIPGLPTILLGFLAFLLVFSLSRRRADIALQGQRYVLMFTVAAIVAAILGAFVNPTLHTPRLWGDFESANFLLLFAVFFPAGTGIMVGTDLSGDLENPRQSIPTGTLSAVTTTFGIYLLMALWYAVSASPDELRTDLLVMADKSAFGFLVLLGLMFATLGAALSSLVGAPRLLQALAADQIIPSTALAEQRDGSPVNAAVVTGIIAALALLFGSLNAIAPIITTIFLITYGTINLIVLIEQLLNMPSFRPTFRVSIVVPTLGFSSCLLGILAISPVWGAIALGGVVGLYGWLTYRNLQTPWETVHSGLFVSIASWAARQVETLPGARERSWTPDLLFPLANAQEADSPLKLFQALARPKGSVRFVQIATSSRLDEKALQSAAKNLIEMEVHATTSTLASKDFGHGAGSAISVMKAAPFPPNIVFVDLHDRTTKELTSIIERARATGMGLVVWGGGVRSIPRNLQIGLWLSEQSPNWELGLHSSSNLHLPVLLALQLHNNAGGDLHVHICVKQPADRTAATDYLRDLRDRARLPNNTRLMVHEVSFAEALASQSHFNFQIFGLSETADANDLRQLAQQTATACLFVRDSGFESAFA